jgi:hypothetical protein
VIVGSLASMVKPSRWYCDTFCSMNAMHWYDLVSLDYLLLSAGRFTEIVGTV